VLRLYTAPASNGGTCQFITISDLHAPATPKMNGGGECTLRGGTLHSTKIPFQTSGSWSRRPNGPGIRKWIPAFVDGWVSPALHATRVQLEWRQGTQLLPLKNNYFISAAPILYSPPFRDLPFYLVAYTANNHEVARHNLGTAGLYIDWKKDHVESKLRAYKKAHPNG
jgi:hypothetical protein